MAEMQSDSIVVAARESREKITRIAAAHGVRNVRVIGSAGRNEAGAASDLDLLVDVAEGRSLFDLVVLSDEVEESLGIEVVAEGGLSPSLRDRILDEAVAPRKDARATGSPV